jgi:hypothetical protein
VSEPRLPGLPGLTEALVATSGGDPSVSRDSAKLDTKAASFVERLATTPRASQGVYELPCGYLDQAGNLYTEVVLREISGNEEDLLANPQVPANKKINELLARCVVRLGPYTDRGIISQIVSDLTVGDRAYLIFAIRRISLGDDYPFKDVCPECEVESLFIVNLSELSAKPTPDPRKRSFEEVLPGSAKLAKFHPMTGRDEDRLAKIDKGYSAKNKNNTDTLSLAILMRLDALDHATPTLEAVKSLGILDRNFLRSAFDDNEGGLNTEDTFECPHCEAQFTRDVDISQQGFFFPSAMRKSLKVKSST